MRTLAHGLVCSILLLAGCTGTLVSGGTGGTGGSGTGGTIATGGTNGAAGSPGTVTLEIMLPTGETFCDENASCGSTEHLSLMTASGQPLALSATTCGFDCSTCAPVPCPELPVIACPAGHYGVPISSYTFSWTGAYFENGSCSPIGNTAAIACTASKIAPAGTYIAQFCATPGTLSPSDGGGQLCTATGAEECTKVQFSFPSSQPVVLTLPGPPALLP